MTTIYLAGPYSSRDLLAGYRDELIRVGYKVRARWLDGAHETDLGVDVETPLADRQRWAREDLADVNECDVLVAFTSAAVGGGGHSGGRHVETGYALGCRNKQVILVGEPENVFHWLPQVTRVPDWYEALIELSSRLVRYEREAPRAAAVGAV